MATSKTKKGKKRKIILFCSILLVLALAAGGYLYYDSTRI